MESIARFVGLDLGAKVTAVCEVNAEGDVVREGTVGDVKQLVAVLGPKRPKARVAFEACREAWYVHDLLREWGNEVVVVDTTRARKFGLGHHGRKNDALDAQFYARALAKGSLPEAHVLSANRREIRKRLGVRRALVRSRSNLITQVRELCRAEGHKLPQCSSAHFLEHVRLTPLPPSLHALVAPVLCSLCTLEQGIADVDEALHELAAQEGTLAPQLATVPGVGVLIALAFVAVIDDPARFRRASDVVSYLGLAPSESSTGGRRRLGSITKQGNTYLRALLVQAAWCVMRSRHRDDPLVMWAHQLAARRGKRIAVVGVARRLARLMWAMWRDGTVYTPEMLAAQGASSADEAAQRQTQYAVALRAAALRQAERKLSRQRTDSSRRAKRAVLLEEVLTMA
ncbi:MAG: IS110 family transposase [Myxococcales bacterium]|nr:IS110 family transposase [Myxococcales bacterium]